MQVGAYVHACEVNLIITYCVLTFPLLPLLSIHMYVYINVYP